MTEKVASVGFPVALGMPWWMVATLLVFFFGPTAVAQWRKALGSHSEDLIHPHDLPEHTDGSTD